MTLLGMIITVVVLLCIICFTYYVGKAVGYVGGVRDMLMSWSGDDVTELIKKELKEMSGGKSE